MSIDLQSELANRIHPDLVKELLADYVEMKSRFLLRDLAPSLTASGRFCEDLMKCLKNLKESKVALKTGIIFNDEFNDVMKYSKNDTIEEILYHQIPLVAKSTYTIRNKRRVSHSRGEDLLFIDMVHIIESCNWMLANLLRASHGVTEDDAIDSMVNIIEYESPIVFKFGSWNIITRTDLTPVEGLVILLFSKGGVEDYSKLVRDLKLRYSQSQSYKAISSAHKNAIVFRDPETNRVVLLEEGQKLAAIITKR